MKCAAENHIIILEQDNLELQAEIDRLFAGL